MDTTAQDKSLKTSVISIPNEIMMADIAVQIGEGRSVEILCRGNSMNPFLCDRRDSIILSPCNEADIKVGDVVLARTSYGNFVVHRVAALGPMRLNGDGNFRKSRELIPDGNVLAVMSGYKRKGRYGKVTDAKWRLYSALWDIFGKISVGNWDLRRITLGLWRRLHRSLVHIC